MEKDLSRKEGYTTTEILGSRTLSQLNELRAKVVEEEKSEDFKGRHPLNGAIANFYFIENTLTPIIFEVLSRTGISYVDLNTWRVFGAARISYVQNSEGAENGVNFTDLFKDYKVTPEKLEKAWDKKARKSIADFGKLKRSDIINKFQKTISRAIK